MPPHTAAFGVSGVWEDRIARYARVAEVRSAEFVAHADDEVLDWVLCDILLP